MPYNQVSPPLMRSLLDPVPEPKETQVCSSIQPHSAGPAELLVPEPVVKVSCILMSSLVFMLCGTLLELLAEHDMVIYHWTSLAKNLK